MFYAEDHLRITKVRTHNGMSPVINQTTGKVEHKIIFAPLNPSTKKLFEDQNTRLPTDLKMKIEVVKAYKPEPVQAVVDTSKIDALTLKNLELEEKIKQLEEEKLQASANKQVVENIVETSANTPKNKADEKK